jgi:hypothetical protein
MDPQQWTVETAQGWLSSHPWIFGCNFLPSSAVNSTEMWQAGTFDAETIQRELRWAQEIGFNSCRVFLQHLVWQDDPEGQKRRMDHFLSLASAQGISTMFVLFDDCAFSGKTPYLGAQGDPVPGVHNSGWTPSPSPEQVIDPSQWHSLGAYLRDLLGTFSADERIVAWDLYNEPGNNKMGNSSLPLVNAAFDWAQDVRPTQPLTVGIWQPALESLNETSLRRSDLVSFHSYADSARTADQIAHLRAWNRPLLCTEWLHRPFNSRFQTHLPLFREAQVGCYSWGLVAGRTQTYHHWGSEPGTPAPSLWQHDVLHADGTPYDPEEILLIQRLVQEDPQAGFA